MRSDKKYGVVLRLTGVQANILEKALDVYSRLGMGQLEIVGEALNHLRADKCTGDAYIHTYNTLRELKTKVLGHPGNSHSAIAGPEVHDDAKIIHDLQKVVQKVIAGAENYRPGSVWHHGAWRLLGSEPEAGAEVVDAI